MKHVHVVIPEEAITVHEFIQDGKFGIAELNRSLIDFDPKRVFAWHCSIMVHLTDVDERSLPTEAEMDLLINMEAKFSDMVLGPDTEKPNGIFLARIEHNETMEFIWRVYRPKQVYNELMAMIEDKSYARPFDFRIDPDEGWALAAWHLEKSRL